MRFRPHYASALVVVALVAGCSSTATSTPSSSAGSSSAAASAASPSSASTPTSASAAQSSAPAGTETGDDVVTIAMVTVGDPGNPSVGVVSTFGADGQFVQVPKGGGIYASCDDAPKTPQPCFTVGQVGYAYQIAETETTVGQYVTFLNVADPSGTNQRGLYTDGMNPQNWPKYGSVAYSASAADGQHYSVAYPEWTDKPFGFANFLRAARFANSLYNGTVLSTTTSTSDGFAITTYEVRLSEETESGMYDMSDPRTTRKADSGFEIPSNDEWLKAAYYDPKGGGTHSYWQYPTGPSLTAPNASKLDPHTGDVINSSDQPLSTYSPNGPKGAPRGTYPTWCPKQVGAKACAQQSPLSRLPGMANVNLWQGNVSTVGQTKTRSPWGTLDQGGNVVEWQDTIVDSFKGYSFDRVWRRMHGGVANAPSYQMLLAAFGFQPQDQAGLDAIYPWFGFRVGMVGALG